MYRKNVASQFFCFQGVDASTGSIKSGVTWTVRRCIDGTFAAGGGTVTEDSTNGWYKYAMSQADTNGNDISFNFTGADAVPQTVNILTTACDPSAVTNFGMTALPAVATGNAGAVLTAGTGTAQVGVSGGAVSNVTTTATATNLTNAPTNGDFTATMKTSIGTAVAASAVASVTGNVGGNVTGSVGSVATGGIAAASFAAGAVDAAALAADAAIEIANATLTTAMTEAYAADGAAPTLAQMLFMLWSFWSEVGISGMTKTAKKLDGTTTAMTFTLDSATQPTAITRAS